MALPDIYQEVEWIWASGSQYINTWYVVNANTSRIYTKFEPENVSTSQTSSSYQNPLFWTRTSDYSYETALWASPSSQTYSVWLTLNWYAMDSATPSTGIPKYPLWTVIELDYWKTWGTYNDFSWTWNAQYQWVTPNLLIFWIWSQGSVDSRKFYWKLYSFKIWEWNNLVRDFVTCYRKSDGVIWLYDLAGNTFYTNAWSWTFTKWPDIKFYWKITHIYLWTDLIRPKQSSMDFYYSDDNWNEYQSLVSSVWSVQFVDTWSRYRFQNGCYIWNRTAVNVDGTTFKKVNLDTLTVISSKSSTVNGRLFYFWDNRILTKDWIMDFDGNIITSFSSYSFRWITVWLPWEVWWLDNSYGMYKGIVNWDSVTFTKVWTSTSNSWVWASPWNIVYWRLWTYTLWYTENSTQYLWFYNASTWTFSTMTVAAWQAHMSADWQVMPDWKIYKHVQRNLWWWKLYKIWTAGEWAVWSQLSTSWTSYWIRYWKFLWNVVSWWMSSQNGTGNWYWSNNYFINSSWTVTLVQSNAFAYDTSIYSSWWFVDENWWIYPYTSWWGSGVILKTDKTFTDFPWWNPYLYR